MHVRCPHCRNPIEVVEDQSLAEVDCPSCGISFNLIAREVPTTDAARQTRTIAHFELLQQIGVGQFGNVWKARDTELDRIVAIKIPRKDQLSETDSEQFFREARAAAQLNHPNIVPVHEVGREGDIVYIVSDYVEGATLSEWLSAQQPTAREAAELCAKIADALHHAHVAGVIHRDLKPGNIMMDMDGKPHIMDFGLAKRESGEITMTVEGQILGTPAYMPPEQAKGEGHQADRRSDVYSLGVILFELLTGELPFRGETRMLIVQILRDKPPSPRRLNNRTPKDLETICLKCLEKDPARRYRTAAALAEDLTRWLAGQPIHAKPPTLGYLLSKFACRHWVPLSAATAAVLAVAVFVAIYVVNVTSARDRAEVAYANEKAAKEKEKKERLRAQRNVATSHFHYAQIAAERGLRVEQVYWIWRAYDAAPLDDPRRASARNLIASWSRSLGNRVVHEGAVVRVAFSPDGQTLLTGSDDKTARLWDAATGKPHGEPLRHELGVTAVAFSPDGKTVLTGSRDKTARLWDAATGQPRGKIWLGEHAIYPYLAYAVNGMAFSPDGKTVLVGIGGHGWDPGSLPNLSASAEMAALAAAPLGNAWLWDVPPPAKDDPVRLRLSVEVRTGYTTDEQGRMRRLKQAEWLNKLNKLHQLGGPCDIRSWEDLSEKEKAELRGDSIRPAN